MSKGKQKKKYDETNLIKVEGEGLTKESICLAYIDLMNDGFSLTVEEVASYLRCTYQHVIDKITPEIKHIRITEVAKIMLLKYSLEYGIGEDIQPLIMKRILFNKKDFKRYICETAQSIISYKRFYEEDFDPEVIKQIKSRVSINNKEAKGKPISFENYMQKVMNSFIWKDFKNEPMTIQSIEEFPEQLYSQKDLTDLLGLNYKVEFYRFLESNGLNKIKIGNMVRYKKEDVVENFLAVMYISVIIELREKYGDNYIGVIQRKALEF